MLLRIWALAALTPLVIGGTTVNARPSSDSIDVVESAIENFERKNLQGFKQLLAPSVRFDNVFSLPNTPSTFRGRDAVIGNIRRITDNFKRIEFVDERIYAAQDGRTVFVEARGNFVVSGTGAPYRNIYVFAFEINNGQISAIREYNNPLTIAETFRIPISQPATVNTQ